MSLPPLAPLFEIQRSKIDKTPIIRNVLDRECVCVSGE